MEPNNEITKTNSNIPSHQFNEVLEMIQTAKQKVFAAVNTALIDLYWQIGCYISQQMEKSGWGKSVVEELANYIRTQEPNSEDFSKQNLWRMKQFYETYKDAPEILSTCRENLMQRVPNSAIGSGRIAMDSYIGRETSRIFSRQW